MVLARNVINPTYRSEYLARVAEGLGRDSSRVILEYVRRSDLDNSPQAEKLTEAEIKEVEKSADDYLVEAEQVCREIDRPIWKNTALERTAINAGESQQYPRAFSIARSIQNAEARSHGADPGRRVAMPAQAGREATKTYAEVAEAVARVEQDGLRGVLTGYLVDSLISTGRFEDARLPGDLPHGIREVCGHGRGCRIRGQAGLCGAGPPVDRQRCAAGVASGALPPRQQRGTCQDRQLAAESLLGPGGATASAAVAVSRERRAGTQIQRPGKNASCQLFEPAFAPWPELRPANCLLGPACRADHADHQPPRARFERRMTEA